MVFNLVTMKLSTLLLALGVLFAISSTGQTALDTPQKNRIIIKYFPGHALNEFQQNNPVLFDQLRRYFVASFSVERIDCANCPVDYDQLFNYDLFDVRQFEAQRAEHSTVELNYRNKYRITLLSKTDLMTVIDGQTPETMFIKTFPKWGGDYEVYKNEVYRWSLLFPEAYRTFTTAPDLLKISISEFSNLPGNKVQNVLSHPGGYLIID